jgi:hypothetical protein
VVEARNLVFQLTTKVVQEMTAFWKLNLRDDQEGLFKLVTLDRILNRITGVTSCCWWLVVVNAIAISDICKTNKTYPVAVL